ncbi:MAG: hypothetical protein ACRDNO_22975, partial [Trebonia sp.]
SSALAQARERLGSEPLRELFERTAVPCAQRSTAGAWLAGRRLQFPITARDWDQFVTVLTAMKPGLVTTSTDGAVT